MLVDHPRWLPTACGDHRPVVHGLLQCLASCNWVFCSELQSGSKACVHWVSVSRVRVSAFASRFAFALFYSCPAADHQMFQSAEDLRRPTQLVKMTGHAIKSPVFFNASDMNSSCPRRNPANFRSVAAVSDQPTGPRGLKRVCDSEVWSAARRAQRPEHHDRPSVRFGEGVCRVDSGPAACASTSTTSKEFVKPSKFSKILQTQGTSARLSDRCSVARESTCQQPNPRVLQHNPATTHNITPRHYTHQPYPRDSRSPHPATHNPTPTQDHPPSRDHPTAHAPPHVGDRSAEDQRLPPRTTHIPRPAKPPGATIHQGTPEQAMRIHHPNPTAHDHQRKEHGSKEHDPRRPQGPPDR